ncbi:hypothetical protein LTR20_009278 [Exophiala xenobiotica]|nr:hypothetical protein LTR40_006917 [Exophiala xenobiotica]KAK5361698.1 hypothetical protein LTS13_009699 [Exophiala xenobiotica]KAK5393986.1 hypothetical protein LTR79_008930 [Exophiala xenobiotica]KAK5408254.1 hypothetical protein LTR90_009710 [Exophiala xenobiotica]KAK5456337.1 hypothetical protein LTR20_009278 [Exophiala xenobiotica]
MASTREKAVPGLIMVPMSLKANISVQECDDWYNNEHVPIRMRLPYFNNGYRYRSIENDVQSSAESGLPEWLGVYDILDMCELTKEPYRRLLDPGVQSKREHQVLNKVTAWRRYYDLVSTYEAPQFVSQEQNLRNGDVDKAYGVTLIVVGVRLRVDSPEAEAEWDRWYEEDHLPPLRKVPGWLRTRRYRTSVIEDVPPEAAQTCSAAEYLTLNEFATGAAIGGPEHQIAIKSESRTNVVARKWRHSYKMHYLQTPVARDLAALQRSEIKEFVSPDGLTRTLSGPWPSIESYITTRDNMIVRYSLEGVTTGKGHSPVLVLCTLADLSWGHWDSLVRALRRRSHSGEMCHQILRLEFPVRVHEAAEHDLSKSSGLNSMSNDLEDCFQALMIDKASLLLILGHGRQTTEGPPATVTKSIGRANVPGPLAELCLSGAIIVSYSRQDLKQQTQSLGALAADCASLDDFVESVTKGINDM